MPWFENAAGHRLWYEEYGAGTPVVFIHGWCMSSAVWELQREGLSGSSRVIMLDLPGHGNSPPESDSFHMSGCATDIAGLLEYLDLHDVILAGWSLGAFIAIEAFQLCKERLSGLVLISGTPRFVQSDDFPYGLMRVEADGMANKVRRSLQRALKGFVARMFAAGELRSDRVNEILSSIQAPTTEVALSALAALVEADMRGRLASISCPTLVMYGDADVICLPKASEFMARLIPMSLPVMFSGCGHVPFITQSRKFNACLEEFMGRVCSGGEYR